MRDTWIKVVIGISVIVVAICIVLVIYVVKPISAKRETIESETIERTKYELDKKTVEYNFRKIEDYKDYLLNISEKIKPIELQNCVSIRDEYNRLIYGMEGSKDGNWVLSEMTKDAYRELLCRVIRHGEDWSELPLTEHFREKFNPGEGVLNDQYYNYEQGVYLNPGFNYKDRTVVTLCADENGNKYYGWYDFVLNDEGYLDDVIFNHREEITDDILIDG